MFILSSSPPPTTFFTSTTTATTTPKARVSFSFSVRFCTRRQPFPSLFHSFKVSATAEMLQDKESSSSSPAPPLAATTSSGETSKDSRTFLNATTEQGSLPSSFFSFSSLFFSAEKNVEELTKTEIPNYFLCSLLSLLVFFLLRKCCFFFSFFVSSITAVFYQYRFEFLSTVTQLNAVAPD